MPTFAQKLTKRSGGTWIAGACRSPPAGFPYWLFQALVTEAGGTLANADGTETDFASPACVEALHYWIDLAQQVPGASAGHRRLGHHAARFPRAEGGDDLDHHRQPVEHPRQREVSVRRGDAAGGQAARHADGRRQFLSVQDGQPAAARSGVAVPRWISSPERAAQWGIDTGYVATRPDAWETPAMRKYVADFPAAAVARDQLQYAVAELSTHDNQRVTQALNDGTAGGAAGAKGARERRWPKPRPPPRGCCARSIDKQRTKGRIPMIHRRTLLAAAAGASPRPPSCAHRPCRS